MRVTADMRTEGGQPLSELADFTDRDGTGVQALALRGTVCVIGDSTSYPNTKVWLDPDDAEAFARLLIERAQEARGQ